VYVRVRLIIFDALWFGGDFAGQVQSLQECLLFSEMQNVQHINSCWSSLGIWKRSLCVIVYFCCGKVQLASKHWKSGKIL